MEKETWENWKELRKTHEERFNNKNHVPLLGGQPHHDPKEHLEFHHLGADGYITFAKKEWEEGRGPRKYDWKQYHYRPEELKKAMNEWTGIDVYFSQNTFYLPKRKVTNIRQLRALYCDVDCHMFNYLPEWTVGHIEEILVEDGVLPMPNFYIFSGQGVCPVWLIKPVPYQALPLWQSIQNNFIKKLKKVGADPRARDAARVFRLAGSKNSKNDNPVYVVYRHNTKHDLKKLRDEYLPELKNYKKSKKKKGRKPKVVQLYNIQQLHYNRVLDLEMLCELRDWNMKGYREFSCFLRRYWLCCFLQDPREALEETLEFNEQFREPLTEEEVINATKSAEKAWEARSSEEADKIAKSKGYPGAGYNYSNKKLIQELDINEEEQKNMRTIIGKREKYNRNNKRRRKNRRKDGKTKRERQKGFTLDKLKKALRENPMASQKELAKKMGVTQQYISKLLKELE